MLLVSINAYTNIKEVPDDFPTIQQAIDEAGNGDTVFVSPGTYYENINLNGKLITIASLFLLNNDPNFIENTIIDESSPAYEDTAS